MSNSSDQAQQLADLFSRISDAVDQYRTRQFDTLTPQERDRLEDLIQQLDDIHDRFTATAIQDTLNAIRDDLGRITQITDEARQSVEHLNTTAEVVKLVSAVAELGEAIIVGDYGAIPQSIKDLAQAFPQKSDKNASSPDQSGS